MIPVLFNILFFLIPLVFFKNTSELFEFNKIVTLYIGTTLITSIWIINSIKARKFIFRHTILDIPLTLYLLILLLSTIFSIDPRTSWLGYYGRFNGGLLSQICYAVLYWAFVSNIDKAKALRVTGYALVGTATASILAILEHFGIFATCGLMGFELNTSCWVQDVQNRVFSTLGQPNWLAALLVALIPISWAYSLRHTAHNVFSVLFFVTLLFTKSRSGLLAFGIEFIIFWGFVFWKEKLKYIKEFLVLSLLTLSLFFIFKTEKNAEPTVNNNPVLESGGTESGTIRKYVWLGAFEVFKYYPILGTGPETFAFSFPLFKPVEHNLTSEWDFIYNKAHNEFLNYLANTGILGFLSYIALIVYSLVIMFKSKEFDLQRSCKLGLLAGYFGILVTNFFGFSVVPVSLLFFIFPAIAAVSYMPDAVRIQQQKLKTIQKLQILAVLLITYSLLHLTYRYWQADIHYNNAKISNNLEEINKAIAISPNEPNYLAQLAFITSDPEISLKALSLNPYNQNSRKIVTSNLAINEAENVLLDGIMLSPNGPRLHYQLGILQLKIGKNEEGLKNLERSIGLKPNYKEGRFALGVIYKALEEKDKAKDEFEYIINHIDPNDELAKKYLDELE